MPDRRTPLRLACFGAGLILAVDLLFAVLSLSVVVKGLLDWTAHAASMLLFLLAIRLRPSAAFLLGALLGTTLIDLDHLPKYIGWDALARDAGRPYTHSLLTVLAATGLAWRLRGIRRRMAWGVAFGLAAHLVRDLGRGGVPLLWPLLNRDFSIPYPIYLMLLLVSLVLLWLRAAPRRW